MCTRATSCCSVCGEMGIAVFVVLAVVVAFLSSQSLQLLTKCVQVTRQSCYQGGAARGAHVHPVAAWHFDDVIAFAHSWARGVRMVGCHRDVTCHRSTANGVHDCVPGGCGKHAKPCRSASPRAGREHVRLDRSTLCAACCSQLTPDTVLVVWLALDPELCGRPQHQRWLSFRCVCCVACTTCDSQRE